MKREDLKKHGIEDKDVIKAILDQYNDELADAKDEAKEEAKKEYQARLDELDKPNVDLQAKLDEALEKLSAAEEKLQSFDGVDIEQLKTDLNEAQTNLAKLQEESTLKMSEMTKDGLIKEAMSGLTFSSNYAKKGVFDELKQKLEIVEEDEGFKITNFDDVIKTVDPSAFVAEVPPKPQDEGTQIRNGSAPPPKPKIENKLI